MAEDISKKITIDVEADTEKLNKNINDLNKVIDSLLEKQKALNSSGKQNTVTFKSISSVLDEFQKKLKDVNTQIAANTTSLNSLKEASKTADTSLSSLTDKHQKHAKATGDASAKVKELGEQVNALGKANKSAESTLSSLAGQHEKNTKSAGSSSVKTKELNAQLKSLGQAGKQQKDIVDKHKTAIDGLTGSVAKGAKKAGELKTKIDAASGALKQQATGVAGNKKAFDAHKVTMDLLKKSFNEIENVSGTFGPSLKDAADGFTAMKKGLSVMKGGIEGIGAAIKADGLGFLLQILQKLFDWFIKSSTGSKVLSGAISAIGIVVKEVKTFIDAVKKAFMDALSHPVESLKSLGKMIEENIINRFKAFSIILDGIIHLDFKKVANGAIQAFTGVTDATDKIVTGFNKVKKGVEETAGEMVTAYKNGYKEAGEQLKKHEAKVKESVETQAGYYRSLKDKIGETCKCEDGTGDNQSGNPLTGKSSSVSELSVNEDPASKTPDIIVKQEQKTADSIVKIKKSALDQVEDYAKKNGVKTATDALKVLSTSIKQASDTKVAALEKDKAAELSNTSLTSAQKLAINQKYKKQEDAIKAKAFKEQQEISIMQALINGAIAITKAPADLGPVAGAIAVAAIIASTAAQVATIAKQKPPLAKGGYFQSDGKGAILPGYSHTDDTNAYLRSGEAVVVSEAMQVPWARNLVSAINVGFGGRDFSMPGTSKGYAVGGIFTDGGDANRYYNQPVNDQKNLANTIAYQMINNFPPVYVDVKDVNNQQNILAQTINRVNL